MSRKSLQLALEMGLQRHREGRLAEAEVVYREVLTLSPGNVDALNYLGVVLFQTRRFPEATGVLRQALALHPHYPDAHNNLGLVLKELGELEEALSHFEQALALRPNYPEVYNNIGAVYLASRRLEAAIAPLRRAVELNPRFGAAWNSLGSALMQMGKFEEGLAAFQRAAAALPNDIATLNNLAGALAESGQLEQGLGLGRQLLTAAPNDPRVLRNLGMMLVSFGKVNEALPLLRRAVAMAPQLGDCRASLAAALLVSGQFEEGWREHEWRWQSQFATAAPRGFAQPAWDGADPKGKTILLHMEQGFGDAIQFIRYAPRLAGYGARIVFECTGALRILMSSVEGIEQIVETGAPLPPFDWHLPLLSLPAVFGTTLQNIPANIPYIRGEAARIAAWQERLTLDGEKLGVNLGQRMGRIGVAWAGNPGHRNDRNRSLPPRLLEPLRQVPGVQFYSLQKSPLPGRWKEALSALPMIDYTADFGDFAETAAFVANLDLVIAVDTAVVHLAGALGKPVWVLLPFSSDWRWMLERDDSPWYPTMRLFRQPVLGDWATVMHRVAESLANYNFVR